MQEEMLESISAICKVTVYLKRELSQDPHKLRVSQQTPDVGNPVLPL